MTAQTWTEAAVRAVVDQQFRELLRDVELEDGDSFFRHGGNSLGMLRLITALDGHGLPLTAREFVTHPTPDGIVRSRMARLSQAADGEGR